MIKFVSIDIVGYKSIRERLTYNFSDDGLHLIVGKNGSGKSNFLESILWCIHGKTIKGLKVDQVVNWDSDAGTKVELIIEKNNKSYKIIRCRGYSGMPNKPAIFEFVDGQWTEIQATNPQDIVDGVVNLTWDETLTSVYYSAENFRSFLEMRPDDRKRFMERIFGVSMFDAAYERATVKRKELRNQSKLFNEKEKMVLSALEDTRRNLAMLQQKISEWEEGRNANVETIQKELETVKAQSNDSGRLEDLLNQTETGLKTLYERETEYASQKSLYTDYSTKKAALEGSIKFNTERKIFQAQTLEREQETLDSYAETLFDYKRQLREVFSEIESIDKNGAQCSVCGSIVSDNNKAEEIMQSKISERDRLIKIIGLVENRDIKNAQDKQAKITEALNTIESDIASDNQELASLVICEYNAEKHNAVTNKIAMLEKAKQSLINKIDYLNNVRDTKLQALADKLEGLKSQQNPHLDIVSKISEQETKTEQGLNVIKNERGDILYLLDHVEFLENAFRRDIKGSVLSRIIPTFNYMLNDYLSKLFDSCTLSFDNNLDSELSYNGIEIDNINQFSTGQRARLNLAICLSVFSVLNTYREATSIMFFDELLDFGLDESGQDIAFELLSEFTPAVYVVSHRAPQANFKSVIRFSNDNGTVLDS